MFESRLLTKRRVDFGAIVEAIARRSWAYDYYGDIGVDGLFEVYRWMTSSVTGPNWNRWSWPTRWVRESIAMNISSRVNCGGGPNEITPFRCSYDRHQDARRARGWRDELASRFAHALLDDDKMAEWRAAMGIDLAKPRSVSMLVYDRAPPPPRAASITASGYHLGWDTHAQNVAGLGAGLAGEVDRLFSLADPLRRRRLIKSPNEHHPDAVFVTAVMLAPTRSGWKSWLEYGVDGSSWEGEHQWPTKSELARDRMRCTQKKGEPFANFIYRAHDRFESLLTPPCRPRARVKCAAGSVPKHEWTYNHGYAGVRCEA